MSGIEIVLVSMFVFLIIGLLTGHPLAFVLGGVSVILGYLGWGDAAINIVMMRVFDSMNNYFLVAIPMFVLMANFLTHAKIADGLFESIRYLFGPVKGGLGVAVVLVGTIFATTTGIVGASVITMGMLATPVLLRNRYKPELAVGMVCASSSLGILLPPSIMLVTMGTIANVSIGSIFIAVLLPSIMLSFLYGAYVFVSCQIKPDWGPAMSKEELVAVPMSKRLKGTLVNLVPVALLIIAVLGSIFGGFATPTEASGVGAFIALLMTVFYRQFSVKMLITSLVSTMKTTSMVYILLFGANAFTSIFIGLGGSQLIINAVEGAGISPVVGFLIMATTVFVLGLFLDWMGVVLLVFPIFLPIMDYFGFDRLFIVVSMAVLLQTCFITPPFGLAVFYLKNIIPSVSVNKMFVGCIPFVIIIIFVFILCLIFPQIITHLPSILQI